MAEANRGPTQAVFGKPEGMLNGLITSDKSCWTRPGQLRLAWWRRGHFKCPCHQSTFDVLRWAQPVFGPAAVSLPQLPLVIDGAGFLRASGDFSDPVGPAWWTRG